MTFQIEHLQAAIHAVTAYEQALNRAPGEGILAGARRAGVAAEAPLREYPRSPGGRPRAAIYPITLKDGTTVLSKWKSVRQRAWFFSSLEKGTLHLPYRRTGFLGNSITHRVDQLPDAVVVVVGSNLNYAPYVIGDAENQSPYHTETGWQQIDSAIEEALPDIQGAFLDGIRDWLLEVLP